MPQRDEAFDPSDWPILDHRHVWHPYTQMATAPVPVPIVRAEGAYLYTADGRAILDAVSSWWVLLHGHGEPRIARAIGRQAETLDQVIFAGFTHEPAARLAAKLVELTPPGLDRVFYSDDGSTSVEVALKMARQHWVNLGRDERRVFIALEGAYHGDTVGAMSVGAVDAFQGFFRPLLFDVVRARNPFLERHDADRDEPDRSTAESICELDELLSRRDDVAALIIEPLVQGAGGMILWPQSSLGGFRELCDRHDILLIADEVFTGFGRTGAMFACDHGPITPDIICLSKALTGGTLPLAATIAREEIYRSFLSEDRRKTLFHGHSFTANPIACAAALESIALLEEHGLDRVREIHAIHEERLGRLRELDRVRRAGSIGLIARLEVIGDRPHPDELGGYLDEIGPVLYREFLERDLLLRPLGNVLYLVPPLAMSDEDLHRVYDAVEEVLTSLG